MERYWRVPRWNADDVGTELMAGMLLERENVVGTV